MNALVWLAIALAVVWFLGIAVFKVVGFAIHIALIAAVVLLIAGLLGRGFRRTTI